MANNVSRFGICNKKVGESILISRNETILEYFLLKFFRTCVMNLVSESVIKREEKTSTVVVDFLKKLKSSAIIKLKMKEIQYFEREFN